VPYGEGGKLTSIRYGYIKAYIQFKYRARIGEETERKDKGSWGETSESLHTEAE